MDTGKLKKFAQAARLQLLEQVGNRLKLVLQDGSLARRESAKAVKTLEELIKATSQKQLIERVAYTWFNRFCALRFMDANRYTKIGTVSPAEGFLQPEILMDAKQGHIDEDLKVDRDKVLGLLDGTQPSDDPQQEAYKLLLVASCNAYHNLMPFMFEEISDFTELLIPDDLLSESSILTDTRQALYPEACQDVEVIGWLYQFYISEKKDDVFAALKKGKKITPENIPAATQLFTPHWIVRYLVENSLGRLWMLNFPDSKLIERMDYYIAPEPEAVTSDEGRGASDESRNSSHSPLATDHIIISKPEEIRICDPACGSGHMLTYAFDLLYAIYEEQGYAASDIPRLILTHNLYGIEIDQRAGALAAFALTMKAREKYRRFLTSGKVVQPNICVLENIRIDPEDLSAYMDKVGRDLFSGGLQGVVNQWEEADNFGSLIRPLVTDVSEVLELLRERQMGEDLFLAGVHQKVLKALRQADYLSPKYHVVVANPPYMGTKGMTTTLKEYGNANFQNGSSDLFAMFMERCFGMVQAGYTALMTPFTWMFLTSYANLRKQLLSEHTLLSLVRPEYHAFFDSAFVPICAFVVDSQPRPEKLGAYIDLSAFYGVEQQPIKTLEAIKNPSCDWFFRACGKDFALIPGSPIAYWASQSIFHSFERAPAISTEVEFRKGMGTGANASFVRDWQEVALDRIGLDIESNEESIASDRTWFPYNNGGRFRKWYGNNESVVNWRNDGAEVKERATELNNGGHWSRYIVSTNRFFLPGITWNGISAKHFGVRRFGNGFLFSSAAMCGFAGEQPLNIALALLNSNVAMAYLKILAPTLNFGPTQVQKIPLFETTETSLLQNVDAMCDISRRDWDAYERSWEFGSSPLLSKTPNMAKTIESSYADWRSLNNRMVDDLKHLEETNNRIFIDAYGLQTELAPEVAIENVTITANPNYRYDEDKSESELEALLLADTMREFISYAVGCMLGRYSLDAPGLILANAGESIEDYYRIVKEKRVASDEGRGARKEKHNDSEELQGSNRLAEGDGSGADGLPSDKTVSQGRTVRADESGATSGSVSSFEHRRGASKELDSGVSQLPLDSKGFAGGSGNSTSDRQTPELHDEGATSTDSQSTDGSQQNAQRLDEKSRHSPLTTDHSFLPDEDNVMPLLDGDWFTDDISERFKEFLKVTFGTEHYEENLSFLENAIYPDNLTGKKRKTIRDYFLKEFYNHHIKLYKKRPIYWLFSSPKGTFNALIYMHRYRPDTVSVVLNDYLREFQTKLTSRMEHLQRVADSAEGTKTEKSQSLKEIAKLKKDLKELEEYEREILYPLATERVEIDLDDGVKVNYNKFGKALKKVTGLTGKA